MQLSLPDTLKPYIDAGVAAGHYDSAEAYVVDLILEAQKCRDTAESSDRLQESLAMDRDEIKTEMRQRLQALANECTALPLLDDRHPDDILYDATGLPHRDSEA